MHVDLFWQADAFYAGVEGGELGRIDWHGSNLFSIIGLPSFTPFRGNRHRFMNDFLGLPGG